MASLIAQLVKNPPAMQEIRFNSWVRKIPWRRDQLPTPVFLGFPGGSDSKEFTCNVGDLGSIPGLERSPGEGTLPTPVVLPGEFHGQRSLAGHSPWCCRVGHNRATFTFTVPFANVCVLSIYIHTYGNCSFFCLSSLSFPCILWLLHLFYLQSPPTPWILISGPWLFTSYLF